MIQTQRNISVDIGLSDGRTVRCHDALLVHPTLNKVLVRLKTGRAVWFHGHILGTFTPQDEHDLRVSGRKHFFHTIKHMQRGEEMS